MEIDWTSQASSISEDKPEEEEHGSLGLMEQNIQGGSWLSAFGRWIALWFAGGSLHKQMKSDDSMSDDQ